METGVRDSQVNNAKNRPSRRGGSERRLTQRKKITVLPKPPRSGAMAQKKNKKAFTAIPASHLSSEGQLEEGVAKSKANSNSNSNSNMKLTLLSDTVTLLHHIHTRNKNQHRAQAWFKRLGILRRSLVALLDVSMQLEELRFTAPAGVTLVVEQVRKRFEMEAKMRGERERLEAWLREVLVPESYVAFSQLLRDGPFAQTAVVLMAVVGDIAAVVGVPNSGGGDVKGVMGGWKELKGRGDVREVVGTRVVVTGTARGETTEEKYGLDQVDVGQLVERKHVVRDEYERGRVDADDLDFAPEARIVARDEDAAQDAIETVPGVVDKTGSKTEGVVAHGGEASSKSVKASAEEDKVKKKSRRRQKNAIDDIFAGF